jgi:DNA-binding LytR/AlgR family response regulator
MRKQITRHPHTLSAVTAPAAGQVSGTFLPVNQPQKQTTPKAHRLSQGNISQRQLTAGSLIYLEAVHQGYLIPVGAIKMVEAEHKRVKVYFKNQVVTLSSSLQYLETRLPADLFVRANRAQILNTSCVESVAELPDGTLQLIPQDHFQAPVILSRRQAALFKQRCTI